MTEGFALESRAMADAARCSEESKTPPRRGCLKVNETRIDRYTSRSLSLAKARTKPDLVRPRLSPAVCDSVSATSICSGCNRSHLRNDMPRGIHNVRHKCSGRSSFWRNCRRTFRSGIRSGSGFPWSSSVPSESASTRFVWADVEPPGSLQPAVFFSSSPRFL